MNRWSRRLTQLFFGLILYGISDSMLVLSGQGLDPWDVLHQGLSRQSGLAIGTWTVIVGFAVLVLWIPLRQRPGIGTLSNAVVIGVVVDLVLWQLPPPVHIGTKWAMMLGGVTLNGLATALYIGAGLGPGPRDGLMTGLGRLCLAGKTRPLALVRFTIEASVLLAGWLLGGTVGIGTVIYAVAIGPLVHLLLPLFSVPVRSIPSGSGPSNVLQHKQTKPGNSVKSI